MKTMNIQKAIGEIGIDKNQIEEIESKSIRSEMIGITKRNLRTNMISIIGNLGIIGNQ